MDKYTKYIDALKQVWRDDEKMINSCLKETDYLVEHNGLLYPITRPSIRTKFCFPYGYGETQEEAIRKAQEARTQETYFIYENLSPVVDWIVTLIQIRNTLQHIPTAGGFSRKRLAHAPRYHNQSVDNPLRSYETVDENEHPLRVGSPYKIIDDVELLDKLIDGYTNISSAFLTRIQRYLKRYGLSKVKAWTYLND